MDISKIIKESIDEYNRIRDNNVVSCVGCVFAKHLNLDCNSMMDCDECYIKSFSKLVDYNIFDEEPRNEAELMRKIAKEHCLDAIDSLNNKCHDEIKKAAYDGRFSCSVTYSDINRYVINVVKEKLENDGYAVITPYDDDRPISCDDINCLSLRINWG